MSVLRTQGLAIGYRYARRPNRVIAEGLDLSLDRAELVCLLGPNGAGKSTLLRTLAGMQAPLAGKIYLQNEDLAALPAAERARRLSIVLTGQGEAGLLSAYDLVALGRYPYTDWAGRLTRTDEKIVSRAIRQVGAEALAHRPVHELSDGERQKIFIARALAQEPVVMILDEPTAFLDLPRRIEILQMLRDLARDSGCTILLSTHDLDLALRSADRLWLMSSTGTIIEGAPEDLVLNGAFETAFQSEGVVFDTASGSFKLGIEDRKRIAVQGEGVSVIWTRRALEREGYEIAAPEMSGIPRVETSDHNGTTHWTLKNGGPETEFASIADLVSALREKDTPATASGQPGGI